MKKDFVMKGLTSSPRHFSYILFAVGTLLTVSALNAQTAASPSPSPKSTLSASALSSKKINPGLDKIVLGSAYQTAYDAIVANTSLDYDGIPEVSLSPGREERIIETRGGKFIKRGIFQFRNEKLFAITLDFESRQIDFYTLFTNFQNRYGEPQSLSPDAVVWDDGTTRLVLEYPLTLKYLSATVIDGILKDSTIQASVEEESRKSFLDRL